MLRSYFPAALVAAAVAGIASTPAQADMIGQINNGSTTTVVLRIVKPDAMEGVLNVLVGHDLAGPLGYKQPKETFLKKAKDGAPFVPNCSRDIIGPNGSSFKMELVQSTGSESTWPKYTFDMKIKDRNLVFSNIVPVNRPSWKATLGTSEGTPTITITDPPKR
jgi:hypothetical protein